MGQFGQFGLNGFKRGQTHLSQLYISLDPDELKYTWMGWLTDLLVVWFFGWLVTWLLKLLVVYEISWLVGCLVGWIMFG